jgi:hypothetical protein
LLTDGRVLIAGGVSRGGGLVQEVELWDPQTGIATTLAAKLSMGRRNPTAALLSDGAVLLWGGLSQAGAALQNGEIYDPQLQSFTPINALPAQNASNLRVEAPYDDIQWPAPWYH